MSRLAAFAKTHWLLTYVLTCIAVLLLALATNNNIGTALFVLFTFMLPALPVLIAIALYRSLKQRRAAKQANVRAAAHANIEANPPPATPRATPESIRAALQRHKLFTASKFLCPCGYEGLAAIKKHSPWIGVLLVGSCLLVPVLMVFLPIAFPLPLIAGVALLDESRKQVVICPSCGQKYSLQGQSILPLNGETRVVA
jgi:hypothetical protein